MGKTVGQILTVVSSVALVATGIGAAAGLALFGTTAGISIFGVGLNTLLLVSSGLSAVAGLVGGNSAKPADGTVSTIKNPTPARQFGYGRRRMYGANVLFESTVRGSTVDVYAFADGQADGVEQLYLNDEKVTRSGHVVNTLPDGKYGGTRVWFENTLGATPNTAFSRVVSALPGIWTNAHRGDGVVTGYLIKIPAKEKEFLTIYPQGDNVQPSMVIRLEKNCYDPRTGTSQWTENPVLHLLHYLTQKRGYDYNRRILPTEQYWIDAANICDELVPLKGGGSEKRYRSCVTYNGTAQPKEVIASLLETFDGWFAPRGDGAVVIYAGKLYEPTVSLGGDEIISYNLPYGVETDRGVDELAVTYVSAPHDYATVETTPWGEPGLRRDNFGPQTPSHSQNRRLAKRFYSRINEFNRGTVTTNLDGRAARGERYINLTIEESGIVFFSGRVEVKSVRRDFQAGGLAIEWVAMDENIDEWNPETEEGEPAALGDRVAPQPAETPVIDTAVAFYSPLGDGNVGPRVRITLASPVNQPDYTWFARWRRTGDSAWNESRFNDVGAGTYAIIETDFLPAADDIEVEVSYRQGNGQLSDWSATETVNSRTDATPPEAAAVPTVIDWRTILKLEVPKVERAASYRWRVYASDGTTLIRTITTTGTIMEYTPAQAAVDGIRREYVIDVAGVNSAGIGTVATTDILENEAPPQVMGVTATGGDYIATLDFTALTDPDLAGYAIFYSKTDGFDPTAEGFAELRGTANSQQLFNLGAGTYYARVAGTDGWSYNPSLLNLSDQVSFVIAIGNSGGVGGSGSGGGSGGPGGGGDLQQY